MLLFSDGVPIDDPCDAPRDGGRDSIVHNYVVVVRILLLLVYLCI